MYRTLSQNKRLYQLFNQLGISGEIKADMVAEFTSHRTEKSSKMTINECNNLIRTLDDERNKNRVQRQQSRTFNDASNRLRRTIFSLMYDIGFIVSEETAKRKKYVIDSYIKKKTKTGKADINELTFEELNKVIRQLQATKRIYKEAEIKQSKLN